MTILNVHALTLSRISIGTKKRITNPFSTYDWVKTWHETIGTKWDLYILHTDNDVVAPFARKGNEVIFAGGDEVADYLDVIGDPQGKQHAWPEIIEYLKKDGVASLHLRNIPEDSPTLGFFQKTSGVLKEEDTTPIIPLPASWEEYLSKLDKKSRHELERKLRKFEREYNDIEIFDSKDAVADTGILLSLMKLDSRKSAFLTTDMELFFRSIIGRFTSNETLTLLYIAGKPAAAMLAFRFGETVMGYNSGFDEQLFSGAGFYLKSMHIKRAIDEGIRKYNFLQGNERYKYDLGGKDFFVYAVDILL